jgi:pyruvate,water dikinase
MAIDLHTAQPIPVPPDFPVTWAAPEEERLFWVAERMHFPGQVTPLEAILLDRLDHGFNSNATAAGLPVRFRHRRINTVAYQSTVPVMTPDEMAAAMPALEAGMQQAVAGLADTWQSRWLPAIKEHLAALAALDITEAEPGALVAALDEAAGRMGSLWAIHFEIAVPMLLAMGMFDDFYRDLFGGDAFSAVRLLQGLPNKSTEADQALWRLSRQALAMPAVRQVLAEQPAERVIAALVASAEGRAFVKELWTVLAEYGQRGPDFINLVKPSWIEDPTTPLKTLKDYVAQPDLDLPAQQAALAGEREALIAEARQALVGYPDTVVAQFEGLLAAAQAGTMLQEDHNFWIDQRGSYQLRRIVVALGERLALAGVIDDPADIAMLTWEQARASAATLSGDRRAEVARARAEMAHFAGVPAPPVLGTPPAGPPNDSPMGRAMTKFFGGPPQPPTEDGVLRGNAGSPGLARGRARVVRSLTEAGALQPGEILVCETTSPPWTPLFATAAAVVTDTGGMLSHCAIVAREYRLPAVVGVGMAMATIQTGQLVEVDGTAGTVRILLDD